MSNAYVDNKIIIQLQIEQKIVLFSSSENLKCIALIKISFNVLFFWFIVTYIK